MKHIFLIAIFSLVLGGINAEAKRRPGRGDDDPFPVSCVNLTGNWKSDEGLTYDISQRACSRLRISKSETPAVSPEAGALIVPDGQYREVKGAIKGAEWTGKVRHRWNSQEFANAIETYRWMRFETYVVEETVQLEKVSNELILESTYRRVRTNNGEVHNENVQKLFRRAQK